MRGPRSWTSSIVGFALAVLLVSWALRELAQVIRDNWIVLVGVLVVALAVIIFVQIWCRRDSW